MDFKQIKNLRTNLGWSLEDLAERLDNTVTRQALSKYENGDMNPSPSVILKLAAVFGVKPFYLAANHAPQILIKAFRKRKGLKAADESGIREQFVNHVRKLIEVRSKCGTPVAERGKLPRMCGKDPEEAAEKLRNEWDIGLAPIKDLTAAIEDNGVFVVALDAGEKFDGVCAEITDCETAKPSFAVGVGKTESGGRYRMTLAHEIGHLVLDTEDEDTAFDFAGAFLAPKPIMLRRLGSKRNRIKKEEWDNLSSELGVSPDALVKRALSLEIIGTDTYRFWNMQLRRGGVKKEDKIAKENSDWLKRNVLRALAEDLITEHEAAEYLGNEWQESQSSEPETMWQLRKLGKKERRKLLAQAIDMAYEIYENEPDFIAAEAGEVYDDGGIAL